MTQSSKPMPTITGLCEGPSGQLHIDDGGRGGVPVIFIHSAAGSTAHFAAQLEHLRKSRRALAIDLRGHGRSQVPRDGDFRISSMAEDITAVADALGIERYVLVGHSMGGAVAVSHAGAHPQRVAGLLLLDPASDGRLIPAQQAQGMMAALRSDGWVDTVWSFWSSMLGPSRSEVKDLLLKGLRSTAQAAVAEPLEDLLTFDPVPPLSRYRGPRLSIITQANETPGAYQRLVPDLPSRKVEGTGHWLQLDDPAQVNRLLDGFLASVDDAR
jgi:pimeloyl-ACP methyl ester carboxylesterase